MSVGFGSLQCVRQLLLLLGVTKLLSVSGALLNDDWMIFIVVPVAGAASNDGFNGTVLRRLRKTRSPTDGWAKRNATPLDLKIATHILYVISDDVASNSGRIFDYMPAESFFAHLFSIQ